MAQKRRTVRSLKQHRGSEAEFVDLFRLGALSSAVSSRGDRYLRLTLEDRTGSIEGFVWQDVELYEGAAAPGDMVEVRARLRTHRDRPQLHVAWLRRLDEAELQELDLSELRPGLDRDALDACWKRVEGALGEIADPNLRRLVASYLEEPGFRETFEEARAAKSMHHAYAGGLLEHTATLLDLARSVATVYGDRLNRDLLLTGAFLHDVAKIREFEDVTGEYTNAGRLVGHIALGVTEIDRRTRELPGFPEDLKLHLMHLVLAHHERAEWGSPVKPQTLEALVLHHLDLLDARVGGAAAWIEQEGVAPGQWTGFWRGGETQLQRTPAFETPEEEVPPFQDIEAHFLREEAAPEPEAAQEPEAEESPPKPAKPARQPTLF
ncbi:3'-5' exoribonuclease YhaM family protein [Deferrisoma palaeochoriense]